MLPSSSSALHFSMAKWVFNDVDEDDEDDGEDLPQEFGSCEWEEVEEEDGRCSR